MTHLRLAPRQRGEADGRRPAGEGSGAARGPLTPFLSPLRGARTDSFRTPQVRRETIVSPNDQKHCGGVLAEEVGGRCQGKSACVRGGGQVCPPFGGRCARWQSRFIDTLPSDGTFR